MNEPSELRINLSSLSYWRSQRDRLPQRFYVAFCLLASSIQDFLLGLKGIEDRNLNWSATCSYYSLVHAGRLLTFLPLGDFPESHAELRKLLSGAEDPSRPPRSRNGYPFDWLRGFTRVAQENRIGNRSPGAGEERRRFRSMIIDYLQEMEVSDAERKLETFGKTLAAAGPLRNDSNYEALLIAHEYEHDHMTTAFARLADDMSRAAESNIPFVIDAFNHFFRRDPDFNHDRQEYESLLCVYRQVRIYEAIRQKLGGSADLEERLSKVVSLIEAEPTGANFMHLERSFSWGIFEGKTSVMHDFENKIDSLEEIVGSRGRQVV